ncbi:hypothetical protein PQ460_00305 [Paenibacillus sp. KACC 21273]|uniref:hypothetical protein n=1 Tax=Paenibacillus sp. KACC 21273 TaxID=3025665 RepID=UPI002365EBE8|nr:hypothetical protein [Paenibacillus sp. KACC 21273]WDF50930.1 hypothetical protein PQ460_00305 [Paenibacillus sp. KACC 21273]
MKNLEKIKSFFNESISYCIENDIEKLIMFIKDEKAILNIKSFLEEEKFNLKLIAVTFPANEKMYQLDDEENISDFIPEAANGKKIKNILKDKDISLVSGPLPFEGIVIPGENYNPYKIIEQTFNIVNPGLSNLVQTVLIATDCGEVSPGERVVVMNAIIAIDTIGTNTRLLFHPEEGLRIKKVITAV